MSETIEFDLSVDKVTEAKGEERVITVALKGGKIIAFDEAESGYSVGEEVEVKLTVKCGTMETARLFGIDKYMNRKVLVLRDRDESLQSFNELVPAAVQQSIA